MSQQKAHRPNEKQTKWLKKNFKKYYNSEIAERFDISESMVSVWLKHVGLTKCNKKEQYETGKKKWNKKQENIWLSSEYSNVSRLQHVERILSINI